MLVLSRQTNESIVIGDGPDAVTITVVKIDGGKVRIGIEVPRTVPVHRLEVLDDINRRSQQERSEGE